jgi:hypothetical protein
MVGDKRFIENMRGIPNLKMPVTTANFHWILLVQFHALVVVRNVHFVDPTVVGLNWDRIRELDVMVSKMK